LLTHAELLQGFRLLRLSNFFGAIEATGQYLDPILEDTSIGKIGDIQAAPLEAPSTDRIWVTSIVMIASPESPSSEFDKEH